MKYLFFLFVCFIVGCTNNNSNDILSTIDTMQLPKDQWAEWNRNANFKDSSILLQLNLPINAKYYIHSGVSTQYTYLETDSLSKLVDTNRILKEGIEHFYLWKIKKYEGGIYDIDVTIKRIIQKKQGGKWNINFDSDRALNNYENSNVGMYKPFYMAMINKTFSMQLNNIGVVKNVLGLSEILKTATDSLLANVDTSLRKEATSLSNTYIANRWQEVVYEFYFLYLKNKSIKLNNQFVDTTVSQFQPKDIVVNFSLNNIKTDTLYLSGTGFVQSNNYLPVKQLYNTDTLSLIVDAYSKMPLHITCVQTPILSDEYKAKRNTKKITAYLTVETKRVR